MASSEKEKTSVKKAEIKGSAFLCIITPVFDPLRKLVGELKSQTYGDFFHVMISNGSSPRIKEFVRNLRKKDERFIYAETEKEIINNPKELLINLGKRREYCLKKYNAKRYVFLDADIKLVDNDYFLKLYRAHKEIKRDILITLTKLCHKAIEITFPIFPIEPGHIDMANFTFAKKIAKHYSYPQDYNKNISYGNDYRFFSAISREDNTAVLNFVSAVRDGNNSYVRVSELLFKERLIAKLRFHVHRSPKILATLLLLFWFAIRDGGNAYQRVNELLFKTRQNKKDGQKQKNKLNFWKFFRSI
jgi:hypothetical protein